MLLFCCAVCTTDSVQYILAMLALDECCQDSSIAASAHSGGTTYLRMAADWYWFSGSTSHNGSTEDRP
eukprot:19310-Heterococcus_DN1.PRE.1